MVLSAPGRAQFTPTFIAGLMESRFTADFEVKTVYCYSIYDMS